MLDFSEKEIKDLVSSFSEEFSEELSSIKEENSFRTYNGRAMLEWNFRFGEIARKAKENDLECFTVARSALWSFVAVLSKEKGQLVLFFKNKNFEDIIAGGNKKAYHYVKSSLVLNKQYDGLEEYHQGNLLDDEQTEQYNQKRILECKKMFQGKFEEINSIVIFTLEEVHGVAISVKAVLLNSYAEQVQEIDLSKYIDADYSVSAISREQPIVKLKKESHVNNQEKIKGISISLKNQEIKQKKQE